MRLDVPASTLRFYDKEWLLPFVERLPGGIRMFQDTDLEWLQIIGCMKKAGMSIRDIRQYIEQAQRGDDTIALRLAMFRRQREVLLGRLAELQQVELLATGNLLQLTGSCLKENQDPISETLVENYFYFFICLLDRKRSAAGCLLFEFILHRIRRRGHSPP